MIVVVGYHRLEIYHQNVSRTARVRKMIYWWHVYLFQSIIKVLGELICQILLCLSPLTSAFFGLIQSVSFSYFQVYLDVWVFKWSIRFSFSFSLPPLSFTRPQCFLGPDWEMLTPFSDVKWPLLGRYLLDLLFFLNQVALNIMNLWKWSYYCLNHDGICSFFRKLKTSFLAVKTHSPGKSSWFSHWMSLFTCMSAPWVGRGRCDSLKWVYLRAVGFWEVLGASVRFMNHLLLGRQVLTAFKTPHRQMPE